MTMKNQPTITQPARAVPRKAFKAPADHPDLPMDPPLPRNNVKRIDPPTVTRRLTVATLTQQPPDGYLMGHVDVAVRYRVPDTNSDFAEQSMDAVMRHLCEICLGIWLGAHRPPEDDMRSYRARFPSARRARLYAIYVEAATKGTVASIYALYNVISGG